jgi:putative ABC transport system permease protein
MPEPAGHLHQRLPAPDTPGFDNALARQLSQHHQRRRVGQHGAGAAVLDQVIRAVEFLFGFTLAAGLVVLFAAVSATREAGRGVRGDARLGAGSRLLRQVQRAELLGVGALAGLLAAVAALVVGGCWRAMCSSSAGHRRPGCRWPAPWPVRCWPWRPAGGACARCCAGR